VSKPTYYPDDDLIKSKTFDFFFLKFFSLVNSFNIFNLAKSLINKKINYITWQMWVSAWCICFQTNYMDSFQRWCLTTSVKKKLRKRVFFCYSLFWDLVWTCELVILKTILWGRLLFVAQSRFLAKKCSFKGMYLWGPDFVPTNASGPHSAGV